MPKQATIGKLGTRPWWRFEARQPTPSRCCRRTPSAGFDEAGPGERLIDVIATIELTAASARRGLVCRRAIASVDLLGPGCYETSCTRICLSRGQERRPVLPRPVCVVRVPSGGDALDAYKGSSTVTSRRARRLFESASEKCSGRAGGRPGDIHLRPGEQRHHPPAAVIEPGPGRAIEADFGPSMPTASLPRHFIPIAAALRDAAKSALNDSDWFRRTDDVRCSTAYRRRPTPTRLACSTSFHHLAPRGMRLRARQRQHELQPERRRRVPPRPRSRRDLVDCMVARPASSFTGTQIPVCPLVPDEGKAATAIEASAIGAATHCCIVWPASSQPDRFGVHRGNRCFEGDLEKIHQHLITLAGVKRRGEATTMFRWFCKIPHHREIAAMATCHARGRLCGGGGSWKDDAKAFE